MSMTFIDVIYRYFLHGIVCFDVIRPPDPFRVTYTFAYYVVWIRTFFSDDPNQTERTFRRGFFERFNEMAESESTSIVRWTYDRLRFYWMWDLSVDFERWVCYDCCSLKEIQIYVFFEISRISSYQGSPVTAGESTISTHIINISIHVYYNRRVEHDFNLYVMYNIE